MSFIEGADRGQVRLLPPCVDDYVAPDALVRVVDAFVGSLDLVDLGFSRTRVQGLSAEEQMYTRRPTDHPPVVRPGGAGSHGGQNLRRSKMVTRRCTVEHPFGTIKRMSGGGRLLTRGLRAVKAEAALSILAFNMLHAVNAFGAARPTPVK